MFIRTFAMLVSLVFLAALPAPAQELDKPGRTCAASKLIATGKKANARLRCEAKAIIKELVTVDPACVDKLELKFTNAFTKAEDKGGCVSVGDAASVELNVNELVQDEVIRQKTGTGELPGCTASGSSCGSCGSGICALDGFSLVCIDVIGATSGCTADVDCGTGRFCINPGAGLCAYPCP